MKDQAGRHLDDADKSNQEKKDQRNAAKKAMGNDPLQGIGLALLKSLAFWGVSGLLMAAIYTGFHGLVSGRVFEQEASLMTEDTQQVGAAQSIDVSLSTTLQQDVGSQSVGVSPDADASQNADDTTISDPTQNKTVALTFDDGPHPVYTAELLDGLKERGVHATFFVIGENIPGNEELIARMEAEGHLIGNHTYEHVKISDMSVEDACSQVEKTSALVREITGHDTEFVRPPFGAWKTGMECSFVMIPVLWDVDPLDWTTSDTSLVVQRVVSETEDQDIILLHDCYESSVQAALQIVDQLQAEGYEFVTVDRLLLD